MPGTIHSANGTHESFPAIAVWRLRIRWFRGSAEFACHQLGTGQSTSPKGDIEASSECWCSPRVALFRSTSVVQATFAGSAKSLAPPLERVSGTPSTVWLSAGLPALHPAAIIAGKFAEWYNWVVQWPSKTSVKQALSARKCTVSSIGRASDS